MDDWVVRAMQRWPDVPALFGWLGLDRRGRWLIRDEVIRHPRIIHTLNRNYACDAHGRWFFQNGPQRGFIRLASTPLILRTTGDETLITHNDLPVERVTSAFVTEEGSIMLSTEHGREKSLAQNSSESCRGCSVRMGARHRRNAR
jgi:Protein of unknown function (DUF2946)